MSYILPNKLRIRFNVTFVTVNNLTYYYHKRYYDIIFLWIIQYKNVYTIKGHSEWKVNIDFFVSKCVQFLTIDH